MFFPFAFVCALLVPGLLIGYLYPRFFTHAIFIPAISWSYLVFIFLVARLVSADVTVITGVISTATFILTVLCVNKWRKVGWNVGLRSRRDVWLGAGVVAAVYSGYFAWVGTYLEIPADVYQHLKYLQLAFEAIEEGTLYPDRRGTSLLTQAAQHWYVIVAYLISQSGAKVEHAYPYAAYINSLFVVLGVYFLALYVFRTLRGSRCMTIFVAVATATLFCAHFGINVFAYIRYYALAPTIAAYVIYMAAIIAIWETYSKRLNPSTGGMLLGVFVAAAALIHVQEMVFILIMAWSMALMYMFRINGWAVFRKKNQSELRSRNLIWLIQREPAMFVVSTGAILMCIVFALSYQYFDRAHIAEPWIVSVSNIIPFLEHLYILNPSYQFYQVLAVWGYLVYVLFVFFVGKLRENIFIIAGMAIPFLTVLNPVFVDVYLRHADQTTLWRMMYMIPFAFVGGFFIVTFSRTVLFGSSIWRRVGAAFTIFVLIGSLVPFDLLYANNPYSRMYTLVKTPKTNHPSHWKDLLKALEPIDQSYIMTDPVTGYVINGITKHKVKTYKFYEQLYMSLQKEQYTKKEFKQYAGKLLIINQRGGGHSEVGRVSRHWPADVMMTNQLYSEELVTYVEDNEDVFPVMWRNDNISIYRVKKL